MKAQCDNCQTIFDENELNPVKDLLQRVGPGEVFPAGECLRCGALCHLVDHCSMKLYKLTYDDGEDIYTYLFVSDDSPEKINDNLEKLAGKIFDYKSGMRMKFVADEVFERIEVELVADLDVVEKGEVIGRMSDCEIPVTNCSIIRTPA